MKAFSTLLRTTLLAPPIAAATFVLAWYARQTFGGIGEAFSLFLGALIVASAPNVMLTLLLLVLGETARRLIPAVAIHTAWRALLFGVAGGALAAGMAMLLLWWLPSGSEVFSVAMLSGVVGGIVTGLVVESMLQSR